MTGANARRRTDRMVETLLTPGLNPESDKPLNEQLMLLLQDAILNGHLHAGDRLPASRAMASRLALSRNTVLAAYDQLMAEGYLESRVGAGTFVSSDLPDHYLTVGNGANQKAAAPPERTIRPLSGMPALDQFPFALWARIAGRVWRHASEQQLQHNDPAGYRPLRQAIADYLQAARGVVADADQIMITSGLQQGLKFVAESVVPHDHTLILEDPGYPGILRTAEHLPHSVAFTGVDDSGAMVPSDTHGAPGMLLVTPSRHYPLGSTMPISRRLELLEWAREHDALIIEDDYDSEFRYGGRPVQSLQGLDGGSRVVYGGSFSKSLFLSLRIGYLILPRDIAAKVIRHREKTESFPPLSDQMILERFIADGHFARHLRRLRAIHKSRLQCFFDAASAGLCRYFTLVPTDAGLHIVGLAGDRLAQLDDTSLAKAAHRSGLGAVPLSGTYNHATAQKGLLFGFANIPEAAMPERLDQFVRELDEITGF
ncbi:PLP-dependent aminotransferase family protein [Kordiimonas lacus]|uniref:Transcriptional regulator, GntR family n=1 Tax=Kordiimonas lacus TaxID=637679 RepID=A0A1G7E7J5_9PROT|nr:PLP-dependent aminotransferase family protein [Kordiimonas lacus]SDE59460.1 transcriptional regulator, GntR family [Kordiimonas lacus]